MRTPMYCYKLTCVSLSSFMYLQLPSQALLVDAHSLLTSIRTLSGLSTQKSRVEAYVALRDQNTKYGNGL
jgi:hypothetical protein